jgi:hypothetical protein
MTTITTTIEPIESKLPIRAGEVILIDALHYERSASTALALATHCTAEPIVGIYKDHLMNMTSSVLYTLTHPRLVKQPTGAIDHLEHEDAGELLRAICRFHRAGALIIDVAPWRQVIAQNEVSAVAGMRNLKNVAGVLGIPVFVISELPVLRLLAHAVIDLTGNTPRRQDIATLEVETFNLPAIKA